LIQASTTALSIRSYKEIKMKKIIFVSFLFLCQSIFSQKIFLTNYASQSDIKVYVVDYQSQADLKVFKVDYQSQVKGNEGLWYFVDYSSQADKKIYFVDYASQSDLKIYFVKYKSQAGWENKSKKHLLY
jgi:hypothetical protein